MKPTHSSRPPVQFWRNRLLKTAALLGAALLLPAAGWSGDVGSGRLPAAFSLVSSFDVVADGPTVHLLVGQEENDQRGSPALFYLRSNDRGETWSNPVAIPTVHAPPGRHQRGHDPQLAVSGDRLMSLWTAQGGGPWGSGSLAIALSEDGGKTWKAGPEPAKSSGQSDAGYRFPAVAADEQGFHVVWIHALGDERSLRYAQLPFGSPQWMGPQVIDPEICACCWNTLRVGADGTLYALYRDQDPSDMRLVTSNDRGKTWQQKSHVGHFAWQFKGCPHVGGGLAVAGGGSSPRLLATVWTGHAETGGAYLLRSDDAGQSWTHTELPGNESRGNVHTDVARLSANRAVAAWDRATGKGVRTVFAMTSSDDGETWSSPRALTEDGASGTHPRIAIAGDRLLVFWTGTDSDGAAGLFMTSIDY